MVAHEHLGLVDAHLVCAVAIEGLFGIIVSDASDPLENVAKHLLLG